MLVMSSMVLMTLVGGEGRRAFRCTTGAARDTIIIVVIFYAGNIIYNSSVVETNGERTGVAIDPSLLRSGERGGDSLQA